MRPHTPFTSTFLTLAVTAALLIPSAARAQSGVGVEAGVSANPDQFYFGGHAELGPVADKVWFRPNVELGVGNDLTLFTLNLDFVYERPLSGQPWRLYGGAGPALNISHVTGDTSPKAGVEFVGGIAHRDGFFTEIKIGAIDSPRFKFGIGYNWGTVLTRRTRK